MSTASDSLKQLDLAYAAYELAKERGSLSLNQWPQRELALTIDSFLALFNNLPAPLWEYDRVLLQAAPLPQISAPTYVAPSGLPAVALDNHTLLIDVGQENLAFTIICWLADLHHLAINWLQITHRNQLSFAAIHNQTQIQQILVKMSFLLGSTMEELVAANEESSDRLLPALLAFCARPWQPKILLHPSLKAQQPVPNNDLLEVLSSLDLSHTQLHIIITDTPAFIDLLSPYVRELREILSQWYQENPQLVWPLPTLQNSSTYSEDQLYWILRDFLAQKPELTAEYIKANATCGIIERHGVFGEPGSYTLIDLNALDYGLTDPRLLLKNNSHHQNGLLLILPRTEAQLLPTLLAIMESDKIQISSLTLFQRAHALNGSAVQLPIAWINGLNGVITNSPAPNMLGSGNLEGLISGNISMGVLASLPGSYCVFPEISAALENERLAIAYDYSGCDLINMLWQTLLSRHQLSPSWNWRALCYSSHEPFELATCRQGLNDPSALAGCYGGACAILRSILGTANKPEAPLSRSSQPAKRSSSSGFRLRV